MNLRRKITIGIEQYFLSGSIALFLSLMYIPLLIYWYDGWLYKTIGIEHEYFSHGLIGIPYAGYIAWTQRYQWKKLQNLSHPVAPIFLAIAGLFYLSGLSDLVNFSLPLMLVGICLWLKGTPGLLLQGMPLLLLFLGTPNHIPYLIEPYTLPLQHFIAVTSGFLLSQLGFQVTVQQIYLYVSGRIVEVAPHCAGLKMLFTSLYVGLLLLHWTGVWNSRLKSILFLASAVIISISSNIMRNALLTLFYGTGRQAAFDWLHKGWGGDLYSACMLGILVFLLNGMEKYFPSQPEH